ncbi:hypothetical protein [Nesterenkonia haasae]|uniref:hypothetical protein n=1 Tax=Nesterenkonia haasae TaxID=2587813 RepID=UPI001390F929|nr:hypothetical protein [Nesterenkonia haasae]NDK31179.1 hypothetical protein [Nesterenkonia haasae]
MTENLDAETFSLDDWLKDAHLPERSCRIFRGGHLIGKLERLQDQIRDEQSASEQTLQSRQKLTQLMEEYQATLEKFGASALTVYLRALSGPILRELRAESDEIEKKKGQDRQTSAAEFWYAMVARSVVAVQPADGERQAVKWTAENIKALDTEIGMGEFGKLKATYQRAQQEVQEPDADFLQKSSGGNKDDTES